MDLICSCFLLLRRHGTRLHAYGGRGALNDEQKKVVVAYLESNPRYRIAALMQHFVVQLGEERTPDEEKVATFIKNYKKRRVQAWLYCGFLDLVDGRVIA